MPGLLFALRLEDRSYLLMRSVGCLVTHIQGRCSVLHLYVRIVFYLLICEQAAFPIVRITARAASADNQIN